MLSVNKSSVSLNSVKQTVGYWYVTTGVRDWLLLGGRYQCVAASPRSVFQRRLPVVPLPAHWPSQGSLTFSYFFTFYECLPPLSFARAWHALLLIGWNRVLVSQRKKCLLLKSSNPSFKSELWKVPCSQRFTEMIRCRNESAGSSSDSSEVNR